MFVFGEILLRERIKERDEKEREGKERRERDVEIESGEREICRLRE